ncbi:hypothetical protein N658DRAFT_169718 [Parathielavia hyrcaniae]|uniref:Uncharacterized protein n=1 Tax=Parathielavia hyrcaniae TaxID=113614 RepID=A0AAN6PX09_9PEZI|nr:hypothetical protein N658DRAFT_169718 [Parathielavia hyrcaniae]
MVRAYSGIFHSPSYTLTSVFPSHVQRYLQRRLHRHMLRPPCRLRPTGGWECRLGAGHPPTSPIRAPSGNRVGRRTSTRTVHRVPSPPPTGGWRRITMRYVRPDERIAGCTNWAGGFASNLARWRHGYELDPCRHFVASDWEGSSEFSSVLWANGHRRHRGALDMVAVSGSVINPRPSLFLLDPSLPESLDVVRHPNPG